MATGANRIKVTGSDGKTYWYNPNTNKLFKTKSGSIVASEDFTYNQGQKAVYFPGSPGYVGNTTIGGGGAQTGTTANVPGSALGPTGGLFPGATAEDIAAVTGGAQDTVEGTPDEEPGEEEAEEEAEEEEAPTGPTQEEINELLAEFEGFLETVGLPKSLLATIESWIIEGRSASEIDILLRQTPEYLAAFPEVAARRAAGLKPISEADILAYRDAARSTVRRILGDDITQDQLTKLLGADFSIDEIAHRATIEEQFRKTDPRLFEALEFELGRQLSEQEKRDFLDPDVETHELDDLYEALQYQRPVLLGLPGFNEAQRERLRGLGFDPDEAFEGARRIANILPSLERLASIDRGINEDADTSFSSLGDLFEFTFAQDPGVQMEILQAFAREAARFSVGGGPATTQGGAAVGLLTPDERARL